MAGTKKGDALDLSTYTFEELKLIAEIGQLLENAHLTVNSVEKVLAVHDYYIKKLQDNEW